MDTRLLSLLPVEQARCRNIARQYSSMGSLGYFAAALIEQALRRADRAIIEGGEAEIRAALAELQGFEIRRPAQGRLFNPEPPAPSKLRSAIAMAPVGRRAGRLAHAGAA